MAQPTERYPYPPYVVLDRMGQHTGGEVAVYQVIGRHQGEVMHQFVGFFEVGAPPDDSDDALAYVGRGTVVEFDDDGYVYPVRR